MGGRPRQPGGDRPAYPRRHLGRGATRLRLLRRPASARRLLAATRRGLRSRCLPRRTRDPLRRRLDRRAAIGRTAHHRADRGPCRAGARPCRSIGRTAGSTRRSRCSSTRREHRAARVVCRTLLSAGGGSGICTLVVLQSLAQARARWGTDRADAIWDASTVRVVLGGLGHADDLTRISRLAGEIDEEVGSASRGAGGPTWSTSLALTAGPPARADSLARPGRALVLHRRTPPIEAVLEPWWERSCADEVRRSLARLGSVDRGAAQATLRPMPATADRGAEPRSEGTVER